MLSKDEVARYSRQLILPEIGVPGQQRLQAASTLVIGAGGLGCPAALYLAAAGVGTITIMDDQSVELSNLHRQILHAVEDIGQAKTRSAARELGRRNPQVMIRPLAQRADEGTIREQVRGHTLVLDGSDNFPTRYLVNDSCVLEQVPLVHGGVIEYDGQVLVIRPGSSACLRCVFPEPPLPGRVPSCQQAGVLGSAAGVIGTLMAHEALKLLLGLGEPLTDRLLVFDGRMSRFREVPVRRDPACAVCGDRGQPPISIQPYVEIGGCSRSSNRRSDGEKAGDADLSAASDQGTGHLHDVQGV